MYRLVQEGKGIKPFEGSVAVVHYTFRRSSQSGKEGALIFSSLSSVGDNDLPTPFVFEVSVAPVFVGCDMMPHSHAWVSCHMRCTALQGM